MSELTREEFITHIELVRADIGEIKTHLDRINGRVGETEQNIAVLKDRAGTGRAAVWGGGVGGAVVAMSEAVKWLIGR